MSLKLVYFYPHLTAIFKLLTRRITAWTRASDFTLIIVIRYENLKSTIKFPLKINWERKPLLLFVDFHVFYRGIQNPLKHLLIYLLLKVFCSIHAIKK